jgi:arylsulfatase A-like enzyme
MTFQYCIFTLFLSAASAAFSAPAKPNIVVILADDLGRGDYSAFGTSDVRTPNIDRICREGIVFENFYANSCVCSPSRAALMSGFYPDRVGVPGVIRDIPSDSWGYLWPRAVLLPALLHKADYHCALVGKWHLGLEPPNTPNDRGFDYFHGFLDDMMDDYFTHLRNGKNFMRENRQVIDPKGHATDLFTDWACDYLRQRAKVGGNFFLYLAYNAPHDPLQPRPDWLANVQQREPQMNPKRQKLVALIEHMDDGIGRVLQTLDQTGLATNTLVIFNSDNGGVLVNGANNGPWRGGKQQLYEGGIRVPFAARWPAAIKPGSQTSRTALTMDIVATACDVTGIKPPPGIDGISFLPTLLGQKQPENDRELYWVRREGGARYGGKTIEALRRDNWKLVQDSPFAPLELFDLSADPKEANNVAAREKKVFNELSAALRLHVQQGGQVPWQREPQTPQ